MVCVLSQKQCFLCNCNGLYSPGPPTGAPLLQPPVVVQFNCCQNILGRNLTVLKHNGMIIGYNIQYLTNKESQSVFLNVTAITNVYHHWSD